MKNIEGLVWIRRKGRILFVPKELPELNKAIHSGHVDATNEVFIGLDTMINTGRVVERSKGTVQSSRA